MLTKIRLRSAWAIVPLYLWLAEPTVVLILIGAVFAILGGLVRAWAAGTIRKNRVLTTAGPYAFTRNPLYFGSFLIGVGLVIASGRPWFVLLLVGFVLIYDRVMRKEERRLERLFGDEYRRYAREVPRFLPRRIPSADEIRGATSTVAHLGDQQTAVAIEEPPLPRHASNRFLLRRYIAHREYQAMLGIAVMFLALAVKLAL